MAADCGGSNSYWSWKPKTGGKGIEPENKIFIRADIKGKDAMKFEEPMSDIGLADKHRFDLQADSAGVIYSPE